MQPSPCSSQQRADRSDCSSAVSPMLCSNGREANILTQTRPGLACSRVREQPPTRREQQGVVTLLLSTQTAVRARPGTAPLPCNACRHVLLAGLSGTVTVCHASHLNHRPCNASVPPDRCGVLLMFPPLSAKRGTPRCRPHLCCLLLRQSLTQQIRYPCPQLPHVPVLDPMPHSIPSHSIPHPRHRPRPRPRPRPRFRPRSRPTCAVMCPPTTERAHHQPP